MKNDPSSGSLALPLVSLPGTHPCRDCAQCCRYIATQIDDPTAYTRPWKGELTMSRTDDRIYEYACHEANYSLENMLRGYRAAERKP